MWPKRDRFGLFSKIEQSCLEIISATLSASLGKKSEKLPFLHEARLKIELLKRFIRIAHELDIIKQKKYIGIESALQDISRDATNWINSLIANPDNKEIPR